MAVAGKVYLVEDAEPEASSGIPAGTFPGTLAGLLGALDAPGTGARSRVEIRTDQGDGP
jgi:hypothetical protein